MKIALMADIHGNAIALRQCLRIIESLGVDRIFFLGDAVGYYPDCATVLALLQDHGVECQKGNHEEMLLSPDSIPPEREMVYRIVAAGETLSADTLEAIRQWPDRREVTCDGRSLLLVHATPETPLNGYIYPNHDFSTLPELPQAAVFMGHTHCPFRVSHAGTLFVNVGSVGQPRDRGDLASFALYDTKTGKVRICRVELDRKELVDAYGDDVHESVLEILDLNEENLVGELLP